MTKKVALTASVLLILSFLSLLIYEIVVSQVNSDRIKKLNLTMHKESIKYEGHDALNLIIKISGDLPDSETELIVFADNRYLEYVPKAFSDSTGVVYTGQRAGGAEVAFLISDTSKDINLVYYLKQPNDSPLIYAGIDSKVNNIILNDQVVSTKHFILPQ